MKGDARAPRPRYTECIMDYVARRTHRLVVFWSVVVLTQAFGYCYVRKEIRRATNAPPIHSEAVATEPMKIIDPTEAPHDRPGPRQSPRAPRPSVVQMEHDVDEFLGTDAKAPARERDCEEPKDVADDAGHNGDPNVQRPPRRRAAPPRAHRSRPQVACWGGVFAANDGYDWPRIVRRPASLRPPDRPLSRRTPPQVCAKYETDDDSVGSDRPRGEA